MALSKPNGCSGCPLFAKGSGWCPDKPAKRDATICLIGEAPGRNEIAKGEPFIGRAGFVLDQWLLKAVPQLKLASDKGEIMIMNTLRCLPPMVQGRPYPKGKERLEAEAHCRQYDKIPDTVHTVILFGDSPQRAFFGPELDQEDTISRSLGHEPKGVLGRVGRVYERNGKRWVFAPHPAFILRQPAFVQHGQVALRIAAGVDKELEPVYNTWTEAMKELRQSEG